MTNPGTQGAPATAPAHAAPAQLNTLGLVALIVAAVGFIFGCIPGALIVGWILLPIAFILAIVSFFTKGKKWMSITALILSVVGTIVSFVVFFAVVANSFNDAFSSGDTNVTVQDGPANDGADTNNEEPDAELGTRENPVPLGSTIENDEWAVVVTAYNPAADEIVAAANTFNEPAPAGSHSEIVTYTVTYKGTDSDYAGAVTVDLVTSAGNVINSFDNMVVLTDQFGMDELFTGASATGSLAFVVPDGDAPLIRVSPGVLADEVFVKP